MPNQPSLTGKLSQKAHDAGRSPTSDSGTKADNALAQARIEKHREAANHVRMTVTGNVANAANRKDDQPAKRSKG